MESGHENTSSQCAGIDVRRCLNGLGRPSDLVKRLQPEASMQFLCQMTSIENDDCSPGERINVILFFSF
jgi:hypothetical protein